MMTSENVTRFRRPDGWRNWVFAGLLLAAVGGICAGEAAIAHPVVHPRAVAVQLRKTAVVAPVQHVEPATRKFARVLTVTVRAGDCLWTIARAHHVTWSALYDANRKVIGPDPGLIYAGERLRLP